MKTVFYITAIAVVGTMAACSSENMDESFHKEKSEVISSEKTSYEMASNHHGFSNNNRIVIKEENIELLLGTYLY